ncbi:MAG: hypothetical protein AB8H80_17175 [Planctomycetota bacterium]
MTNDFARATLRLIAVVVITVGLCMAVYTLLSLVGVSWAMYKANAAHVQLQVSGALTQVGFFGILADLAISAVGLGLFVLSPKLAAKVVE